jgi:thioredoxin 1
MGKFTVDVTDQSFETEVLQAQEVVMVDFWAVWCMPCKAIAPILEQLAEEYQGKLKVAKVDVDNNPEIATQYGIRSIPTLMVFKGGELVDKIIGAGPKDMYVKMLEKHL